MQKNIFLNSVLFTFVLLFHSLSLGQLEVHPSIEWKTLNTPHFQVIFNAKQQDLGYLYAQNLERAYSALKSYFHSFPEKTIVVINDKTDVTNGYATRIPYPHIMAYPVLPGPEESLADTGNWAFELLAHEYTHILTFEPASGVMKPLRGIFGTIVAPNILLPQWWKEGLAVDMETRLGNYGRLRSYFQDATIRAMVEDDTFLNFDIAEVNESIPTWPKGMRPYLFGSLFWSQVTAEKGETIAGALNERQGSRAPYFIETPAHELLNDNYTNRYSKMMNETVVRVQEQTKNLRVSTITPVTIPQNSFVSVTAPAISPNGKHLAVITEDDSTSRSVKIITKETNNQSFLDSKSSDTVEKFNENFAPDLQKDGPPTGSIQRVSWFPDSEKIVYDKMDYSSRYERYSDLYIYNLNSKKTIALSHGLRAREPSVAVDGSSIVFVKLEGGRTHLALLKPDSSENQESNQVEILFSADLQERISYPLFWDMDTILFSLRKTDGSEHLYRYKISAKKIDVLFPEYKNVRFARKTSEGLLFTSGKNGVLNLYLADASLKKARPISHTLTAFFTADIDPLSQEIFATHMTSKGLKVAAILPQDWKNTPSDLPVISPLMADRYPKRPIDEKIEQEAQTALSQSTIEDYSPYGYLWPHYWFPFVSGSTNQNGVIIMAQTSGFDPLKKHSYSLTGSWDTGLNRGSIEGLYLNQVTSLPFAIASYTRNTYLGTTSNVVEDFGAALTALPNMFWVSKYTNLQLGWEYLERSAVHTSNKRTGPYLMLSHATYSESGEQISPESGFGTYVGAYNYIPQDGYLSHSKFLAGGEVYLSSWLPKHHVLMLRTNGFHIPDENVSPVYGIATQSSVVIPDSPLPQYILRGYKTGQIFGRNLVAMTAEYRFPISTIYRGSGTDPLFFRRLSGAIVTDAVAADGKFVNEKDLIYEDITMKRTFLSSGVELKLETTLGYVIPLNLVAGYYAAFNTPDGVEGVFGLNFQITGF